VLVWAEDMKGLDKRVRLCACVLRRRAAEVEEGGRGQGQRLLDEEGRGRRAQGSGFAVARSVAVLRVARRGTLSGCELLCSLTQTMWVMLKHWSASASSAPRKLVK
jgi:hypothetical protein